MFFSVSFSDKHWKSGVTTLGAKLPSCLGVAEVAYGGSQPDNATWVGARLRLDISVEL
jgi:hypothetical protein